MKNEFADYTIEELEIKKSRHKKRQWFIMAVCGLAILVLAIASIVKKNNQVFQLVPFLILSGVAMPYFIFTPMLKKIQSEIDARKRVS